MHRLKVDHSRVHTGKQLHFSLVISHDDQLAIGTDRNRGRLRVLICL